MLKSKSEYRKEVIDLRKKLNSSERIIQSQSIFKKIEQLQYFQNAKIIMIYWSLDDEVYTHDFIKKWSSTKTILLPVTLKDELEIREFRGTHLLKESPVMKLMEPIGNAFTSFNEIDIAIIPGLVFDKHNNRIGYGKAYYDKLLPKITTYKVGVCFDFQLFDKIPNTKRDIKMDLVLTN